MFSLLDALLVGHHCVDDGPSCGLVLYASAAVVTPQISVL